MMRMKTFFLIANVCVLIVMLVFSPCHNLNSRPLTT